jgi:hypothetical protein
VKQLYIYGGFKTFAECALAELNLSKSTAYQYANSGRVLELLEESADADCQPRNEAQIRPLLNVESDKAIVDIWSDTHKLYGKGGVTQPAVAAVKRQYFHNAPEVKPEKERLKLTQAMRRCWDKWPTGKRHELLVDTITLMADFYSELEGDETENIPPKLEAYFDKVFKST